MKSYIAEPQRSATPVSQVVKFRHLLSDRLVRNSILLMASTITMAGMGFVFWVVVARLYTPADVGVGSALVSAATLLAYSSLAGLNGTVIRYLRSGEARARQFTQSVVVVTTMAVIICCGYVIIAPMVADDLHILREQPLLSVALVAFGAFAAINLITDAHFIALHSPGWNLAIDGILQGTVKIGLPFAFVSLGSLGIFLSMGAAFAACAMTSVGVLWWRFGIRPSFRGPVEFQMREVRFSLANYLAGVLDMVPVLILPLLVLRGLGAEAAAFYYIAFQIAQLLNALSHAVGETVFSEASRDIGSFSRLMRKSALLLAAIQIPASVTIVLLSPWILTIFGPQYAESGTDLLRLLAASSIPVAIFSWGTFALRILESMWWLVGAHIVVVATTLGLGLSWMHGGILDVGWAWLIGHAAGAVITGLGATLLIRKRFRIVPIALPKGPEDNS